MQYGPDATPDICRSDDETKLLMPVEDKEQIDKTGETGENGDMGPKVADWRFGPAQLWYDMLQVPETGDGFNYGFKLLDKVFNLCICQSINTSFGKYNLMFLKISLS